MTNKQLKKLHKLMDRALKVYESTPDFYAKYGNYVNVVEEPDMGEATLGAGLSNMIHHSFHIHELLAYKAEKQANELQNITWSYPGMENLTRSKKAPAKKPLAALSKRRGESFKDLLGYVENAQFSGLNVVMRPSSLMIRKIKWHKGVKKMIKATTTLAWSDILDKQKVNEMVPKAMESCAKKFKEQWDYADRCVRIMEEKEQLRNKKVASEPVKKKVVKKKHPVIKIKENAKMSSKPLNVNEMLKT
jgi:hypothetical protein